MKKAEKPPRALRTDLGNLKRWHPDETEAIARVRADLDRANLRKFLRKLTIDHKEVARIAKEELASKH